jgi:3-dehydroquinate synthetase
MALTDSALSNKQAVNGAHGKNHFGMYYAPLFLFGDTRYLATESPEGRKSAIAEGVKNGFISDASLVDYFEARFQDGVENLGENELSELALKIIRAKLRILQADPSEKGSAITLEYGHTFGHAMEFLTKGRIAHGIAVAKGMCIAAELSRHLGYIPQSVVDRHYRVFGSLLGLDLSIPEDLSVREIIWAMASDNKKTAGGTKFVLLKRVGECLNPDGDFQVSVAPEAVEAVLTAYRARNAAGAMTEATRL